MAHPAITRTTDDLDQQAALGAGLHGAYVELESDGEFRLRLCDDRRIRATPAPGVEIALVRECMRSRAMVIVVDAPKGPHIAGALTTQLPAFVREGNDAVTVRARELRLSADQTLRLEAGPVTVVADESGKLRLEGDKLVIDMAALVKVLSMSVELP